MKTIGIIPARYFSTRFPGKVLADILGKPMLQRVWEAAKRVVLLDDVIVATDDDRILEAVKSFGGKAVLTSNTHLSGTDRIAEVARALEVSVIVNIQADEPLLEPSMIDVLAQALTDDPKLVMATLCEKITGPGQMQDPNVVKVLVDKEGYALSFSRLPIGGNQEGAAVFKHIGLYAYTKDFLLKFTNLSASALEKAEKLEQWRALENGYKIKVLETECATIGVDTPEDLEKVRAIW